MSGRAMSQHGIACGASPVERTDRQPSGRRDCTGLAATRVQRTPIIPCGRSPRTGPRAQARGAMHACSGRAARSLWPLRRSLRSSVHAAVVMRGLRNSPGPGIESAAMRAITSTPFASTRRSPRSAAMKARKPSSARRACAQRRVGRKAGRKAQPKARGGTCVSVIVSTGSAAAPKTAACMNDDGTRTCAGA